MNIKEIDKWLDNEYGCSYTRLEELHDFLVDRNMKFQDELNKYKNIVDELEKFLIEWENKSWEDNGAFKDIYDYLQELKGSGE